MWEGVREGEREGRGEGKRGGGREGGGEGGGKEGERDGGREERKGGGEEGRRGREGVHTHILYLLIATIFCLATLTQVPRPSSDSCFCVKHRDEATMLGHRGRKEEVEEEGATSPPSEGVWPEGR